MEEMLPYIPTGEELDAQALSSYWLDPSVDYPEPRYLLQYKGVGFSPLGGIQAISGQKKNGKTFVLAQLMAAILGSGTERVEAKLHGLKTVDSTVEWLGQEPSVLYVDTEMEQLNTAKVLRRVHWLCGWDSSVANDRFRVLWLRQVTAEDEKPAFALRYELIKKAIAWMRPTAVFIDGIRDIIGDFNDNEQSSALVTELMTLATQYNCCIWNVLHANPRPTNDDEGKMRGHLGTELGNKVSDTFVSKKQKTEKGATFTVKQMDARGKDVEDWSFEVTDDAGGLGIPRILDTVVEVEKKGNAKEYDENWSEIAKALREVIQPPRAMSYSALRNDLKSKMGIGSTRADRLIRKALEKGLVEFRFDKYTFNTAVEKDINEDCPF
jgi:hypothetical protein